MGHLVKLLRKSNSLMVPEMDVIPRDHLLGWKEETQYEMGLKMTFTVVEIYTVYWHGMYRIKKGIQPQIGQYPLYTKIDFYFI